jgi:hypothetical protein
MIVVLYLMFFKNQGFLYGPLPKSGDFSTLSLGNSLLGGGEDCFFAGFFDGGCFGGNFFGIF